MLHHFTFCRHLHRLLYTVAVLVIFSLKASGQESEYSDPYSLDDLIDWHEASVPVPYGLIAYGNLPLMGSPDEGASYPNPTRAGLMVYYDAWQAAFEMRPEATYVRLMPRTIGRDGYVAGVLEYGWATAAVEQDYFYSGSIPLTINETRMGAGLSFRSGNSESVGARFLFDGIIGLSNTESKAESSLVSQSSRYYYNAQLGILVRVPLGSFVANAGPYVELGSGMLTRAGVPPSFSPEESYLRLGLQFEVALNLNRPSYLSGAQ